MNLMESSMLQRSGNHMANEHLRTRTLPAIDAVASGEVPVENGRAFLKAMSGLEEYLNTVFFPTMYKAGGDLPDFLDQSCADQHNRLLPDIDPETRERGIRIYQLSNRGHLSHDDLLAWANGERTAEETIGLGESRQAQASLAEDVPAVAFLLLPTAGPSN